MSEIERVVPQESSQNEWYEGFYGGVSERSEVLLQYIVLRQMGYPVKFRAVPTELVTDIPEDELCDEYPLQLYTSMDPAFSSYMSYAPFRGEEFQVDPTDGHKDFSREIPAEIVNHNAFYLDMVESHDTQYVQNLAETSQDPKEKEFLDKVFMASFEYAVKALRAEHLPPIHQKGEHAAITLSTYRDYMDKYRVGVRAPSGEELAAVIKDYYETVEAYLPEFAAFRAQTEVDA